MNRLILSIFPGIDMLGMAFEEEGFTVVRGPDVIWGGDIRKFSPPAGVFAGVIGGPPCQAFSALAALVRANGHEPRFGNLIPEYERCVREAAPEWFIMEEVEGAPIPEVDGYRVHAQIMNNRWLGEEQNRKRRVSFGTSDGRPLHIEYSALESPITVVAVHSGHSEPHAKERIQRAVDTGTGFGSGSDYYSRQRAPTVSTVDQHSLYRADGTSVHYKRESEPTVHSGHDKTPGNRDRLKRQVTGAVSSSDGGPSVRMSRYKLSDACRLQGLPEDFLADAPFTAEGKLRAVANGVPLPMGRAIAQAVRRTMYA